MDDFYYRNLAHRLQWHVAVLVLFAAVATNGQNTPRAIYSSDPACRQARYTSRDSFCCGGLIYFDPYYSYTCCNGKICRRAIIPLESVATYQATTTQAPVQTTQQPSVYCGEVNLSWIQMSNPNIGCCRNKTLYDIRLYDCDSSTVTPPPQPTTPSPFNALVCDSLNYYIDTRIQPFYACCGITAYDRRFEVCFQRETSNGVQRYVDVYEPKKALYRSIVTCSNKDIVIFLDPNESWYYKC